MTALYLIDAFTDTPFSGNPAAVCPLEQAQAQAAGSSWMQQLAHELGYSETCYPVPRADGDWDLRWFTPTTEVNLCGHATLAAAHCLWEQLGIESNRIVFHSTSGPLPVSRDEAGIWLDFPRTTLASATPEDELIDGIGCMPMSVFQAGEDILLELPDASAVCDCQPDFRILASLPYRGVIITAAAPSAEHDFISRFFAPASGIDEDPVTGSAHCALAPFWAQRLGKQALTGRQVSQRGGLVLTRVLEDRVFLGGQATTILSATLNKAAEPS